MTLPFNYIQPEIKKMYIPPRKNTRPNYIRPETKGICVHHTGVEDVPAINFYHALQNDNYDSYASYHIVIDFDGTVFIYIPVDERAFGSGSYNYSKKGKEKYLSNASSFTCCIEYCVSTPDYYINNRQQEVIAEVTADLCIHYNLKTEEDIDKHFDIALDKPYCPIYFIREPMNWKRLLIMSKDMYKRKLSGKLSRLDLYEKGDK